MVSNTEMKTPTDSLRLTDEPVAYVVYAPNGNVRLWTQQQKIANECAETNGLTVTPLYAHPAVRSQDDELLRKVREALEMAHTGLMWYRGVMPEYVDGSDDEADAEISAALSALNERIGDTKGA